MAYQMKTVNACFRM